jgi:hypothetical protein
MATTFTKIASVSVGVLGAASIDFTSIPSTYTDLCIKLSARSTSISNDLMSIQFNSSTSNFTYKILFGQGTSTGSISGSTGLISWVDISTDTANTFGNAEIYIPNYSGSTNKSFSVDAVTENNDAQADKSFAAMLWSDSSAITAVGFTPNSGSFVQYSTATLYGINKS